MSNTNTEYITLPLSQEVTQFNALIVQFNDNVTLTLSTSSFLFEHSSFLQLFDIEEDNNIPILCQSIYVLDENNAFYFDDKTDLLFMFTLDTTVFINLCHFLDIIEYETNDTINEQFIIYVMKHNIIYQLKELHAFMRGEIKSILNYTENISADIQIRTCTPLFYKLYLSKYKEEVIKYGRFDIYNKSIYKYIYYKYIHKYDNQLTYIIKETQEYKQFVFDLNNQLLRESKKDNNLNKIKILVEEYGADVNYLNNNRTALHYATSLANNLEVIKYLVEQGANVNLQNNIGKNVLHIASNKENNLEVIKYLVEHGADVNLQNNIGKTALHIASNKENNLEVIKYLVDCGTNINLVTNKGCPALHYACSKKNNIEVIKYLIEHDADINLLDNNNLSALHDAVHVDNNIEVVKYLVEHGANINSQNILGKTSLHYASHKENNLEVIKYLVEHGANVNARDYSNKTALTVALKLKNNIETINYLQEL